MVAILRSAVPDVDSRLSELGLSREAALEIARAAVAAYGGCTDNDPPSAKGYEPWRFGTRRARELLATGGGWIKDDTANLSSLRHDGLGIRVIMLNTDDVTGSLDASKSPRNRLKKGILHQRAIAGTTGWLPGLPQPFSEPHHDVWYFCLHIEGDKVLCEISRPKAIDNGFIVAWEERIVILGPDDWAEIDLREGDDEGPEFEIRVTRK